MLVELTAEASGAVDFFATSPRGGRNVPPSSSSIAPEGRNSNSRKKRKSLARGRFNCYPGREGFVTPNCSESRPTHVQITSPSGPVFGRGRGRRRAGVGRGQTGRRAQVNRRGGYVPQGELQGRGRGRRRRTGGTRRRGTGGPRSKPW